MNIYGIRFKSFTSYRLGGVWEHVNLDLENMHTNELNLNISWTQAFICEESKEFSKSWITILIFIKKDLNCNNKTNTIYNNTIDYNRFQWKAKLKQLKK